MKVTKIDVFMLDAGAQRKSRKPVCCRIYTDEGIYGDGEAGVAYGVGATGAFGCLEDLAHMVIGQNPFEVEKIWEMLFRETFWGLNGGAIFYAAMSAIDIALMDIKGKALIIGLKKLTQVHAVLWQLISDEQSAVVAKSLEYRFLGTIKVLLSSRAMISHVSLHPVRS